MLIGGDGSLGQKFQTITSTKMVRRFQMIDASNGLPGQTELLGNVLDALTFLYLVNLAMAMPPFVLHSAAPEIGAERDDA